MLRKHWLCHICDIENMFFLVVYRQEKNPLYTHVFRVIVIHRIVLIGRFSY